MIDRDLKSRIPALLFDREQHTHATLGAVGPVPAGAPSFRRRYLLPASPPRETAAKSCYEALFPPPAVTATTGDCNSSVPATQITLRRYLFLRREAASSGEATTTHQPPSKSSCCRQPCCSGLPSHRRPSLSLSHLRRVPFWRRAFPLSISHVHSKATTGISAASCWVFC